MTSAGETLANAALNLVGTPFRLGGRDPRTGLDCLGLVVASLEACGHRIGPLPAYSLRQTDIGPMLALVTSCGLRQAMGAGLPGDILLLHPGPGQHHLAVRATSSTMVHSHAGLRRTVVSPFEPHQNLVGSWRFI